MARKQTSDEGEAVDPKSPIIDLKAEEVTEEPGRAEPEQPEPEPVAQTVSTAPRPKSWVPAKAWGGLALVAIAALGGAWLYKAYGGRPSDEMTAMESRLATLEAENKTLGDQLKGLGATLDELKAAGRGLPDSVKAAQAAGDKAIAASTSAQETARITAEKLAAAEARVAALQKSFDAVKAAAAQVQANGMTQASPLDGAALDELRTRLDSVEKDVAALKAKGPSAGAEAATILSQTLADLKAKLAAGAPYADELKRIASLVPAAPGLDALQASAESGVATAQMLADEAKALSEKLAPPAVEVPAASSGYWDKFLGMLSGVVKVRNIGETDWRDVAAKAGEAAAAGNLKEAISLAAGEGDMPYALRVWREKVQARIDADQGIEEVSAAVLRQIAAAGGAP
jgi:hypothetical protein